MANAVATSANDAAQTQQHQQQLKLLEHQIAQLQQKLKDQTSQASTAQSRATSTEREARKLRRTIVKLNAELDASERELEARGTELDRAADRMERDRVRSKEELENARASYEEDMNAVKEQHASSVKAAAEAHAVQIEALEQRVKRAEEARVREGGDMTLELAEAVQREREALSKIASLEEEKVELASKSSSLEAQVSGMESKVESLVVARDLSIEREREAEDRLDQALSVHARQLGLRQAREAELERTVADMAAALVIARQKEAKLSQQMQKLKQRQSDEYGGAGAGPASTSSSSPTTTGDIIADDAIPPHHHHHLLQEKLSSAEGEAEMLRAQLVLERQRADTLQGELIEVSNERAGEASAALAKQREHDRRVARLTSTVAQLEAYQQRSYRGGGSSSTNTTTMDGTMNEKGGGEGEGGQENDVDVGGGGTALHLARERKLQDEISSLSEDIIRQRGQLQNANSEVQTLRNRLKSAITRAEYAENAAAMASASSGGGGMGDMYDAEMGGNVNVNSSSSMLSSSSHKMMKRKYGVRGRKAVTSIRSALKLDGGATGNYSSNIGDMVDSVDRLALGTGHYFKSDPIARAFFLVYLVILHLWAFCLVLFHAHGTLEPSADVGPEELLKHSYRHLEQISGPR